MSIQTPGMNSTAYWDSRKWGFERFGSTSRMECSDGTDDESVEDAPTTDSDSQLNRKYHFHRLIRRRQSHRAVAHQHRRVDSRADDDCLGCPLCCYAGAQTDTGVSTEQVSRA